MGVRAGHRDGTGSGVGGGIRRGRLGREHHSRYTATLDGLGAVGDGAHAIHEFVLIDDALERTAVLAGLLAMAPDGSEA